MLTLNKAPHPALVGGYDLLGEGLSQEELIIGGQEMADADWNLDTVNPVTNEQTTHDGQTNCRHIVGDTQYDGFQDVGGNDFATIAGRKYQVTFKAKVISGALYVDVSTGLGGATYNTLDTNITDSSWAVKSYTFIQSVGGSATHIRFMQAAAGTSEFYVDEVTLQELYTPDSSGRANHGTVNGATATPWGYNIGGGDNNINLGPSVGDYTDNFTLMALINVDGAGGRVASRRDDANTQWDWYLHSGSGGALSIYDGLTEFPSSTGLADGIDHWVATVINGANSRHFFNGRQDGNMFSPSMSSQSLDTYLGAWGDTGQQSNWPGAIRKLYIYNRALTQREIQEEIRWFRGSLSLRLN